MAPAKGFAWPTLEVERYGDGTDDKEEDVAEEEEEEFVGLCAGAAADTGAGELKGNEGGLLRSINGEVPSLVSSSSVSPFIA